MDVRTKMIIRDIAEEGQYEKLRKLLIYFPKIVNEDISYDNSGKTILHHLTWLAPDNIMTKKCIKFMIQVANADINITDYCNQTPIDMSQECHKKTILDILNENHTENNMNISN
tara:strand:+ start:417 stop:758 length:342 start_codon:yes stop_codon:yes gene_type:complete